MPVGNPFSSFRRALAPENLCAQSSCEVGVYRSTTELRRPARHAPEPAAGLEPATCPLQEVTEPQSYRTQIVLRGQVVCGRVVVSRDNRPRSFREISKSSFGAVRLQSSLYYAGSGAGQTWCQGRDLNPRSLTASVLQTASFEPLGYPGMLPPPKQWSNCGGSDWIRTSNANGAGVTVR